MTSNEATERADAMLLERDVAEQREQRRERLEIATAAMQGLLSSPDPPNSFAEVIRQAFKYADAMLAEAEKETME